MKANYKLGISSIINLMKVYRENHNTKYGSIGDDAMTALIIMQSMGEELEKAERTIQTLVQQRDGYKQLYNEEADKTGSPVEVL